MPTAVVFDTNRHECRTLIAQLAKSSDVFFMTPQFVDPTDSITANVCQVFYSDPSVYHDVRQVLEFIEQESSSSVIDMYIPAPQDVYMGCHNSFTCDEFFKALVGSLIRSRIFIGISHEIFGTGGSNTTASEFAPCTSLGIRQLHNYWTAKMYAQRHGLQVAIGIVFSRESSHNDGLLNYIVDSISRIETGSLDTLTVPSLDMSVDMGSCAEYCARYTREISKVSVGTPHVFVIGSGRARNIRDVISDLFSDVDLFIDWNGNGTDEVGVENSLGRTLVQTDNAPYPPINWSAEPCVSFSRVLLRDIMLESVTKHRVLRSNSIGSH